MGPRLTLTERIEEALGTRFRLEMRRARAAVAVTGLLGLAACGGGERAAAPAPSDGATTVDPRSATFLYAFETVERGQGGIKAFRVEQSTGALEESWSRVSMDFARVFSRVVHPSGRFIVFEGFAAGVGETLGPQSIAVYRADRRNGGLVLVSQAADRSGEDRSGVGVIGSFAVSDTLTFSLAPVPGDITIHRIDPARGTLTPVPGAPYPVEFTSKLFLHPSARFAYTSTNFLFSPNPSSYRGYLVDAATATLVPMKESPFLGATTGAAVFHRSGRFYYNIGDVPPWLGAGQTNYCSCRILGYTVDPASGALTLLPNSPNIQDPNGQLRIVGLTGDPRGRFLYAMTANSSPGGGNYIWALSIDAVTGELSPRAAIPELYGFPRFVGFDAPGAVLDPSGRFRYGVMDSVLYSFELDPIEGKLTPIHAGIPIGVGSRPKQLLMVEVPD